MKLLFLLSFTMACLLMVMPCRALLKALGFSAA